MPAVRCCLSHQACLQHYPAKTCAATRLQLFQHMSVLQLQALRSSALGKTQRTSPRRLPSASPSDTAAMDTASTKLLHSLAVCPVPLPPPAKKGQTAGQGGQQQVRGAGMAGRKRWWDAAGSLLCFLLSHPIHGLAVPSQHPHRNTANGSQCMMRLPIASSSGRAASTAASEPPHWANGKGAGERQGLGTQGRVHCLTWTGNSLRCSWGSINSHCQGQQAITSNVSLPRS